MNLESLIQGVPIFSRLSKEERDEIIRRLRRQDHDQGSVIFSTGLSGDEMHLIESGSVATLTPVDWTKALKLSSEGIGLFLSMPTAIPGGSPEPDAC